MASDHPGNNPDSVFERQMAHIREILEIPGWILINFATWTLRMACWVGLVVMILFFIACGAGIGYLVFLGIDALQTG